MFTSQINLATATRQENALNTYSVWSFNCRRWSFAIGMKSARYTVLKRRVLYSCFSVVMVNKNAFWSVSSSWRMEFTSAPAMTCAWNYLDSRLRFFHVRIQAFKGESSWTARRWWPEWITVIEAQAIGVFKFWTAMDTFSTNLFNELFPNAFFVTMYVFLLSICSIKMKIIGFLFTTRGTKYKRHDCIT